MNFSKKHIKHEKAYRDWMFAKGNIPYYVRYNHYMRSKKTRRAKRMLRKDFASGVWQQG